MNWVAILAVVLCLAACAENKYDKQPGQTLAGLQQSEARCRSQSAMLPGMGDPSFFNIAMQARYIDTCMRAEGYIKHE